MSKILKMLCICTLSLFVLGYVTNLLCIKALHYLHHQTDVKLKTVDTEFVQPSENFALRILLYNLPLVSANEKEYVKIAESVNSASLIETRLVLQRAFTSTEAIGYFILMALALTLLSKWRRKSSKRDEDLGMIEQQAINLINSISPSSRDKECKGDPQKRIAALLERAKASLADSKQKNACLAFQDKLTLLIDRHAYLQHIEKKLKTAAQTNERCGLLFIDLDGFKQVNDAFGHSFGDTILIQVAHRLKDIVKHYQLEDIEPTLNLERNLSRLGGDEFSLFIPHLKHPNVCNDIAQAVLNEIERDFHLGNKLIKIGASIGIAIYPESAARPNALLQMADVAMYRAKSDGRGIFRVYSPEMGNKMRRYHYLLEELRTAISENNFHLSFQPIVHVEDCAIDYFEALVRWHHPVEGMIAPDEFIPIAEETNLILELGDWILTTACRQMYSWYKAGMKQVRISVNVSGVQLKHRDVHQWVKATLQSTQLPAQSLMLEITESTLITASNKIIKQLEECRKMGVTIAIDDFGTGFSSLSTLADLPIDVLKIDKHFINQAKCNTKYQQILRSISELGNQLSLRVIAEGVEELEQFELVKSMGIRCVQGYLVSKPQSSQSVGNKVLKTGMNQMAATGTGVWLPDDKRYDPPAH
ncbi:putative bifunctional diguanylate cyclase/phosphodiesterase [Pseudoalteromonas byunsanensis]|uniref:GGDEF-domain containing protein n=1 Tax=Pseudoalteromonas byunsanensis TaxID=327939 RepID=A0A1S1N3W4_9GAMM|nr:EAL domain-containing protein [Pseudoalteromonas byunsanensis]OHU94359.1 GGDEF-domain containing protein [Pseudoalteromonas byunsanensis]